MTVVLDADVRKNLDPNRHANKPLGLRMDIDPSEYPKKFGALKLDNYCDTTVAVPTTLTRTTAAQHYSYGMLDNDTYGCCVPAGMYHCQESLHLRWNVSPYPWQAPTCLTEYFAINGVPPGPAGGSSDNGTDPATAMNYWQTTGLPGHQIIGWGFASNTSPNLRRLIYEFGAGLYASNLAIQQQSQGSDFVYVAGQQCGSWGGHAYDIDSYDENGFGIITWGELGSQDNAYGTNCGIGLYVPLTTAALNSADVGPGGVALAQMKSDLAALTQGESGP